MLRNCNNLIKTYNIYKSLCLCRNSVRFTSFEVYDKLPKIHEKGIQQKKILQDLLGLQYQQCTSFTRKNMFLQAIDNDRLMQTIQTLKKIGLENDDICQSPASLTLQDTTIEHNVLYLKELGFRHMTAQLLLQFRSVVKRPVLLLKAHGLIDDSASVVEHLLSHLSDAPADLTELKETSEEESAVDIHNLVLKHYLVRRLDTSPEVVQGIFSRYDHFKYKSLRLISELIQLLQRELHFDSGRLLQHGYLLTASPRVVRQTLAAHPTLGGLPTRSVLYKHPKILMVPTRSITEILEHLKAFDVPEASVRKCYSIFTLAPDSVLGRLRELEAVPEFRALARHERVLRLVLYQNKAKMRLEQLQAMRVRCASLHVLCAAGSVFERYAQEGADRTKGTDIVSHLARSLKLSHADLRRKLNLNLNWYHVPLLSVQRTMNYLLHRNFTRDDFRAMPIILFYPLDRIQWALQEMSRSPEVSCGQLTTRQLVDLCLYYIERNFHFSGDGIWCGTQPAAAKNL